MKKLILAALLTFGAGSAMATPLCQNLSFSGLLAKCNRGKPIELTLAAGKPLAEGPITLQSGAYYEIEITSDGSDELGISGPDFFRAVWLNKIEVGDVEVTPLAFDSLSFDKEGEAEISFIAIKPGRYTLKIPGTKGKSQRVEITIE